MHSQSDQEPLKLWITEQIIANGPATMAQFIAWALYHPTFGYYTTGPNIGPRGDFTTSPEASPAFGALMVRHLQEIDSLLGQPTPFDAIEFGPGRGTLTPESATTTLDSAMQYRRGLQALISMEGLGRFHVMLVSKQVDAEQARVLSALKYEGV